MNHWHSVENSLFITFLNFFDILVLVENASQLDTDSQLMIMIGEDYLHIIEKGAVQE